MRKALVLSLVTSLGLLAWACSQKVPAEEAIGAAQTAFDEIKSDARVYVPEQAQAVEDALTAVKGVFDAGNYEQAISDAKALADKVNALKEASEAKRKQLGDSWTQMSESLPPAVEAIQARVTELSKMRRLPKGISKDQFESAKNGLDEITQTWSAASAAFEGGDLVGCVSRAEATKSKVLEVMNLLGLEVPASLT